MRDFARYALYYAPETDSPLGRFGNRWLGRDPESGVALDPPEGVPLDRETIRSVTEAPARYGFHGTLKPPFALADGRTRTDLEAAVERLAATSMPIETQGLALAEIGRFLALVPAPDDGPIRPLAARVVEALDAFRAPLDADALARRRKAGLSDAQEALLRRWGYPYVMEEFRFHLTLTGALDDRTRSRVRDALAGPVADLTTAPFRLDALALFGDPGGGAPFRLLRRFPLSG